MLFQKKEPPQEAAQPNKQDAEAVRKHFRRAVRGQLIMALSALLLVAALLFPMSVAWFTNVARTSSIQFQAEAWGFDVEKINVTDPTAVMLPGDTGFVSLSVDNSEGTSAIYATVHVNKSELPEEMQQRLFFYVDTPKTYTFDIVEQAGEEESELEQAETVIELNAEQEQEATAETGSKPEMVSKQYLVSSEPYGYRYYVSRGECLTLSEAYYNDVPLKWEWVYDMEGYYFIGSITEESGDYSVSVEEYLRPITYNLEEAVFSTLDGQLEAIGETPLAEFLKTVFDADGYEGTLPLTDSGEITPSAYVDVPTQSEDETFRRYYRVAVNENGQGVWAYLCGEEDTKNAASYDNDLGASEMLVNITVAVTNVAEDEVMTVCDARELQEKLAAANGETLQLTEDITVETPLTVSPGTDVTIDLNSYSLLYIGGEETEEYAAFTVPAGAKLTLLNGEVHGAETGDASITKSNAVLCKGGETILGAVKVDGFDTAVSVDDRETEADSIVKIVGCSFDTAATAVLVYGNGAETEARSRVIIQNSNIQSNYIGISGQGTDMEGDQRWGTELVVLSSTVKGQWAGIYHPQQRSSAIISDSVVSGYTGLVVKGGTVTLYDSEVSGTGEYVSAEASDGFTDTGDGIYVEATYPWSATVTLRGTGNCAESEYGYALELFGTSGKGYGKMIADGGSFFGGRAVSNWNGIGTFSLPTETEDEML